MTHDPNLPNRFAIIPVFPSTDTKEAIVIGDYKEVMEYIPQSVARDDAMAKLDAARLTHDQIAHAQERTRTVQKIFLLEGLKTLAARADSFATRQRERRREAKARRDAAEAKRIQDALDALPDPDDPHAFTPSGELHSLPGKEEAASLKAEDTDNIGDLPEKLRDLPDPVPEPKGSVYPQPVSISLNKE